MSSESRSSSSTPGRCSPAPTQSQLERLQTVHLLTQAVARARRIEEIYEAALDGLTRALAADRASILLFDPDGVMRFKAWRGLSDRYRSAVEGHSPWKADAVDPEPIVVPDVRVDASLEAFRPLFESEGIRALAFIPLTSRGRLLGKFMVYFAHPYTLNEEEIRLAQVIAGHVAFAVDRRRDEEKKEEFLAVLAHELRNPLMPLMTCLELMRADDDLAEETDPRGAHSRAVRRAIMERQVRNLKRLVDDLLDVSRMTLGRIELQRRPVSLASVMEGAVETARPWIESNGLHLSVRVDPTIVLQADSLRLEQALANLLSNAAKYTPHGGHVKLTGIREGETVVLRVKDDGAGIASDVLPRVFDIFMQGGRSAGGLGVGLTLVRTLVGLHGGTVEASSPGPGAGSEFTIRLPLVASEPLGAPTEAARTRDPGVRPLRVLVVDDNVDAANLLAEALRLRGHEVAVTHDGASALACAAARVPDLVLLDIGLPDLDGYEVARRFREELSLRSTRIVALSGYGREQYKDRFGEAGLDDHVVKPIDLVELDRVLAAAAAVDATAAGRRLTEPAA
ncbi:MAG TPA: ATP-binding protein [Candidatus Eisenbacteria bacterium]|nr:ATP-binding protein [Candidatus Eisenbacteria bacterium]